MGRNVVVTLADQKHILQAKQLFSSVYFNAGWTGDFCLLSYLIPDSDLIWFRKKGITIKKCRPLFKDVAWNPIWSSKLNIFSLEMKRWDHLIYLDTDIIVRSSLDRLTHTSGFAAAPELDRQPLFDQFILKSKKDFMQLDRLLKTINTNIDMTKLSFNAGVIAFNTNIINTATYDDIVELLKIGKNICKFGDQSVENIFFYKKWNSLPIIYNLNPNLYIKYYRLNKKHLLSVVFHFSGLNNKDKPWYKNNLFNREWLSNLKKSSLIGEVQAAKPIETWSENKIWIYEKFLLSQRFLYISLNRRFYYLNIKWVLFKIRFIQSYPQIYEFLKQLFHSLFKYSLL
jgi:lipopolysaccharide biosynthesis glycosyltransferase